MMYTVSFSIIIYVFMTCSLLLPHNRVFRVNGVPSLGWDDTVAYLVLPVLLVISQFVSMQLMQPKTEDPQQQQANVILKFLPIMIGWFSLNVPSALCVYWIVNNIVTTTTTLLIRNSMPAMASSGGSTATTTAAPPTPSVFSSPPLREKPAGFGATTTVVDDSEVKPITATAKIVDAEVVTKETVPAVEEVQSGTGMETSASSASSSPSPKKVSVQWQCECRNFGPLSSSRQLRISY